jgi:D-lyxose ketol-isomerase
MYNETPGHFPAIEEDEPPLYLLCNDYPRYNHPALQG